MLDLILGSTPQIKLLNYLLSCPFGEYTKEQLSFGCEISPDTLEKVIDNFLEYGLLTKSCDKYSVNLKSPYIRRFNGILDELNKYEFEKQLKLSGENFKEFNNEELDEMLNQIPDVVDCT